MNFEIIGKIENIETIAIGVKNQGYYAAQEAIRTGSLEEIERHRKSPSSKWKNLPS